MYDESCSTSDPKRSWSVKIYQIENVTVKKTFAGTDQTTWNRVKLRYFDWPVPVFIRFIEISRIYRNIWSEIILTGNYIICYLCWLTRQLTRALGHSLLFFTELCILRIIPNLNQRVAKNKQTINNNRNKKPEWSVRLSSLSCDMPVSEVFFFDECRKTNSI